jgi:hypothetical protein
LTQHRIGRSHRHGCPGILSGATEAKNR